MEKKLLYIEKPVYYINTFPGNKIVLWLIITLLLSVVVKNIEKKYTHTLMCLHVATSKHKLTDLTGNENDPSASVLQETEK